MDHIVNAHCSHVDLSCGLLPSIVGKGTQSGALLIADCWGSLCCLFCFICLCLLLGMLTLNSHAHCALSFSLCLIHCALFTVLYSLCVIHCALFTVFYSLCSIHCALFTVPDSLCFIHCALFTLHCMHLQRMLTCSPTHFPTELILLHFYQVLPSSVHHEIHI